MWNLLWVWMAWETYTLTGDRAALADYYLDVRESLQHAEGFLSARDLFDIPEVWNLVDWAAQDLERDGEVISNTVLMAQALDCAALMAEALGKPEEVDAHRGLAVRLPRGRRSLRLVRPVPRLCRHRPRRNGLRHV